MANILHICEFAQRKLYKQVIFFRRDNIVKHP